MSKSTTPIHIIGGGLAGSEAAWQISQFGLPVVIHEMRPVQSTDAHKTSCLAELVCSNSFRSDDAMNNAVGLLHEEMRRSNSLILACGDTHQVPAGGALAVDRNGFARAVERALTLEPLVTIERGEVKGIPPDTWDSVIIATGPLTAPTLADAISDITGEEHLAFFDAIAPILYKETVDLSKAWFQSRYDKPGPAGDTAAYINCPLDCTEYKKFIGELLAADKVEFRKWEKDTPYFESCLPIEVMAARGPDTLRFGPMKPVGLTNPHTKEKPHAVVQLRQDNSLGTLYNMVGFQTKLTFSEQKRILRMIPGLQNVEFARLGGIHRNTFLNSPALLDPLLRLKTLLRLRFAGQLTGVEGYVESAAIGLLAGRFAAQEKLGQVPVPPPNTTAIGALLRHITRHGDSASFQPMNVNFGLFPPLIRKVPRRQRKPVISQRALADLGGWLGRTGLPGEKISSPISNSTLASLNNAESLR